MAKPRVVKDYEKLTERVQEQIKLVYPLGFTKHLVSYVNKAGERKKGLPFETEEYYYLIRMSESKAELIVEEDDDYNEEGILKKGVEQQYLDKYEDADHLNELNNNDDNSLGED